MRSTFYYMIVLLTIFLGGIHYLINQAFDLIWHQQYWLLYLYFPFITAIIYKLLLSKAGERPQLFVNFFMGSMTVKLLFSLAILLVVLLMVPELKPDFAIVFMLMYFAYTILSTMLLFKKLKQNSSTNKQKD